MSTPTKWGMGSREVTDVPCFKFEKPNHKVLEGTGRRLNGKVETSKKEHKLFIIINDVRHWFGLRVISPVNLRKEGQVSRWSDKGLVGLESPAFQDRRVVLGRPDEDILFGGD